MKKLLSSALISAAIYAPAALSADEVKIGFLTTLTTGAASIGQDQEKAVNLALKHIDNTMGGKPVNLIMADDGCKPKSASRQPTSWLSKTMLILLQAISGHMCCSPLASQYLMQANF